MVLVLEDEALARFNGRKALAVAFEVQHVGIYDEEKERSKVYAVHKAELGLCLWLMDVVLAWSGSGDDMEVYMMMKKSNSRATPGTRPAYL